VPKGRRSHRLQNSQWSFHIAAGALCPGHLASWVRQSPVTKTNRPQTLMWRINVTYCVACFQSSIKWRHFVSTFPLDSSLLYLRNGKGIDQSVFTWLEQETMWVCKNWDCLPVQKFSVSWIIGEGFLGDAQYTPLPYRKVLKMWNQTQTFEK